LLVEYSIKRLQCFQLSGIKPKLVYKIENQLS
jgi:hypothetical protein